MAERTLVLENDEGLHARPAGILVKKASEFKSTVEIRAKGVTKSARSIMGLMGMGLAKGDELTIVANGEDAELAVSQLEELIRSRFVIQ